MFLRHAARAGSAALALALVAALAAAPHALSPYYRSLVLAVLADTARAVAWAFLSGPTRYLSLATGAFFGAGAYATAMTGGRLPWPVRVAAGVAALLALLVGVLAMRLRGPYFAVFTFGLAELGKHVLIWYEMRVSGTVGRLLLAPRRRWRPATRCSPSPRSPSSPRCSCADRRGATRSSPSGRTRSARRRWASTRPP